MKTRKGPVTSQADFDTRLAKVEADLAKAQLLLGARRSSVPQLNKLERRLAVNP
ncbi:MAG TPA: hypothetical protein VNF91_11120 [Candidatus Acidoferrum sp.]|nr:hypothetical protein [Candidatus Acidoferrum sp.]